MTVVLHSLEFQSHPDTKCWWAFKLLGFTSRPVSCEGLLITYWYKSCAVKSGERWRYTSQHQQPHSEALRWRPVNPQVIFIDLSGIYFGSYSEALSKLPFISVVSTKQNWFVKSFKCSKTLTLTWHRQDHHLSHCWIPHRHPALFLYWWWSMVTCEFLRLAVFLTWSSPCESQAVLQLASFSLHGVSLYCLRSRPVTKSSNQTRTLSTITKTAALRRSVMNLVDRSLNCQMWCQTVFLHINIG